MPMPPDPLAEKLRLAWRATLARHEADRVAGRTTDSVRRVAERFLALVNDKPAASDAVAEMELRATVASTIMAEVEAFERGEG